MESCCVGALGWAACSIYCGRAVRRAGGDPARSVLIGDTATDRNTARAAGVPSVLVTFGPGDEDVRALAPEATIDHFDELLGVVQRLMG